MEMGFLISIAMMDTSKGDQRQQLTTRGKVGFGYLKRQQGQCNYQNGLTFRNLWQ